MKLQSVKLNGRHIGNVSKTPHAGQWTAWSAIAQAYIGGPSLRFTAKTRTQCTDWLKTIAENAEKDRKS